MATVEQPGPGPAPRRFPRPRHFASASQAARDDRARKRREQAANQTWERTLALAILREWNAPRTDENLANVEDLVRPAAEMLRKIEEKAPRSWICRSTLPRPNQPEHIRPFPSGLTLVPPRTIAGVRITEA